nr:DUF664 domain-containing protein [Actinopolymorpha pittospori]
MEGFLERGRSTLLHKCAGLTAEQLALRTVSPSSLSLLGLIRHVTDVERTWFPRRFAGRDVPSIYGRPDTPNAAFDDVDSPHAEAAYHLLVREWEVS